MGNEQSAGGASSSGQPPTTSTSTFSFLASRGNSVKKSKGIVVVRDGQIKQEDPMDDSDYKRLMEIPRFFPILRSVVSTGNRQPSTDSHHRVSHRPIWKLAIRLQDHLHQNALTVTQDQTQITAGIKTVDVATASVTAKFLERKKRYDRFRSSLAQVKQLQDEVARIQVLLEEIVPCVEVLNELLAPSDRLPPLNLGSILERTPASSTTTSNSSRLSSAHPSPHHHIAPIEETRVIDKY